jgi:hypothetical protein
MTYSRIYERMNVFGSAGFVANSGSNGALSLAALNVVLIAIGLFAAPAGAPTVKDKELR